MTSSVRRASGTRSPSDVLMRAIGVNRRTSADDLEDYRKGVALKVTCLIRTAGADQQGVPINGSLYLRQGEEIAWHPNNDNVGRGFPGPLRVTGRSESRFGPYAAFELSTGSGPVTAFIPKADVPLVKGIMRARSSWDA